MSEEAYPEAAAILSAAGWKPHNRWGVYTRDTLVMGFQPDGQAFHVKNWASIQEGHPQWNADTPDTAEEAAAWLVEHFKPNPLTTEATLDPVALQSEEVENPRTYDEATAEYFAEYPEDESNGETGEEAEQRDEAPASNDGGSDGGWLQPEAMELGAASRDGATESVLDADFTIEDLGGQEDHADLILEGGDPWTAPELPAPEPEDFAPDEIVEEETGSGAFIFGDNLAHDRLVRIAQLAEHANGLIDSVRADYDEGEYNTLLGHVMRHLDGAGAYNGGDQTKVDRFKALENIKNQIRLIEIYRDEQQDFIRAADREAVAAFDPAAGWP